MERILCTQGMSGRQGLHGRNGLSNGLSGAALVLTIIVAALLLLISAGCGGSGDSNPVVDQGETFTLAVGETRTLSGGSGDVLTLRSVTKDTRVGPGEETSLPGTLEAEFSLPMLEDAPAVEFPVTFSGVPMRVAGKSGTIYQLEITAVEPGKNLADTISQGQYRITVNVRTMPSWVDN